MKTHSTNYYNTLVEIAEDSAAKCGTTPPAKPNKTVAERQYEMIAENPYRFTSDDVFFQVFADRNDLTEDEYDQARKEFFSKGQPCFRASPLTKSYGWGVHSNQDGKVALYGVESPEYMALQADDFVKKIKAMKSKR